MNMKTFTATISESDMIAFAKKLRFDFTREYTEEEFQAFCTNAVKTYMDMIIMEQKKDEAVAQALVDFVPTSSLEITIE